MTSSLLFVAYLVCDKANYIIKFTCGVLLIPSLFSRFNQKAAFKGHSYSGCSHCWLYVISYYLLALKVAERCDLLIDGILK